MEYTQGNRDHQHDGGSSSKKRNCHRHTPSQIQRLQSIFKEYPHPDEKLRMRLSRELGITPKQVKFWFQNHRNQMKVQRERLDIFKLRDNNDKIRSENIALKEALKNCICPNCGPVTVDGDSFMDVQRMRLENLQLKEELDRVSNIAAMYTGKPWV
ncbi:hypothetical protein TanjilG_31640 [Lupinus angustifolius]|uniref:homeobox-leucine zipper protein HDG11-like n=1 Tax=Lupinus angustifolius TaxID=3871 RepID=UPI00090DE59E|nr:PREDICTED: homeobox-leucine zipper protein HDG11-like [Lupinus angustifolius]OIV90566.1 hypothetical protein TanjilG_31640 [Lupinus angustifolius]